MRTVRLYCRLFLGYFACCVVVRESVVEVKRAKVPENNVV